MSFVNRTSDEDRAHPCVSPFPRGVRKLCTDGECGLKPRLTVVRLMGRNHLLDIDSTIDSCCHTGLISTRHADAREGKTGFSCKFVELRSQVVEMVEFGRTSSHARNGSCGNIVGQSFEMCWKGDECSSFSIKP